MKVFIIRAQGLGYLYDHIYDSPPSEEVMRKVLASELISHGLDKAGEPRKRWVRVVEIDVQPGAQGTTGELKASISPEALALLKLRDAAVAGQAAAGTGDVAFSGVGTVTNPQG